jgi:hypothetical protein
MEEQRGILLSLLACYAMSGWMIDRAYHTEFFMISGAITAYHALCVRAVLRGREQAGQLDLRPSVSPRIQNQTTRFFLEGWTARQVGWRSYRLTDALAAACALQLVIATWDYILTHF